MSQKGIENVMVGHELRMNVKKGVFWLQFENPFKTTRSVEATWRTVLERQVSMRTIRSHGLAS
jgi:hypothetical protein